MIRVSVRFGKFLKKNYLLVLILLLASLLRFGGIIPGYPPIHTDEGISHSQGMAMILEKTLDPKHGYGMPYNYPIIVPLINAFFYLFVFIPVYLLGFVSLHLGELGSFLSAFSAGQAGGIFEHNILGLGRVNVVFWGRIVTAFFGVGVVFLSYFLGKKLFQAKAVGLLAAFFVAINYRQVLNSHFGLPDIYNAFFLLLALYEMVLLWERQTLKRYLLVGVLIAVYFSTKFQFFALPPLALVLIYLALQKKGWHRRLLFFIDRKIFLMVGVLVGALLLLNIYHLLHLSETIEQVGYSALKYRYGKSSLDFYSILYLYHIGLGSVASVGVIAGIISGLVWKFKQMLLLLLIIVPFMWMFVYYTGGGFYTRNFVTITPLLLITAAFFVYWLMNFLKKRSFLLMMLLSLILLLVISYQSLSNSLVVAKEYSQDWNYKIFQSKLGSILPKEAVVLTDPSMVLPQKQLKTIKAQSPNDYLLAQLQEQGVEWIVLNTEWFNIHFLWWMSQDLATTKNLGWKPDKLLFNTLLAKRIWELKNYVVFEALNPWQAPDNNYLVIKIPPKFSFKDGKLIYKEDFSSLGKWQISNDGFGNTSQFSWDKDFGYNRSGSLKIAQDGGPVYSQRFISPQIAVVEGYLYKIQGWIRSSQKLNGQDREVLLGADFISGTGEVIKTSLSSVMANPVDWQSKDIITLAPKGAEYLQLYFQSGTFVANVWLDDVQVWQSDGQIGEMKNIEVPYIQSQFNPSQHLFLNTNGGM